MNTFDLVSLIIYTFSFLSIIVLQYSFNKELEQERKQRAEINRLVTSVLGDMIKMMEISEKRGEK